MNDNVYSSEEKADRGFLNAGYTSVLSGLENNISDEAMQSLNNNEENVDPSKSTILYVDDNKELVDKISAYLSEKYNGRLKFYKPGTNPEGILINLQ